MSHMFLHYCEHTHCSIFSVNAIKAVLLLWILATAPNVDSSAPENSPLNVLKTAMTSCFMKCTTFAGWLYGWKCWSVCWSVHHFGLLLGGLSRNLDIQYPQRMNPADCILSLPWAEADRQLIQTPDNPTQMQNGALQTLICAYWHQTVQQQWRTQTVPSLWSSSFAYFNN